MFEGVEFDQDLIRRYDASGPRYTSYPTAVQFHEGVDAQTYADYVRAYFSKPVDNQLSLYFHLPFCNTVCYYCGCNKVVTKDLTRSAKYVEYLLKEIAMQAALIKHSPDVIQLHWGGGTPTFLNHDEIRAVMDQTRRHFNLLVDDAGEYSIEIDPRTVDQDKLSVLREVGFNRISLGVQDFNTDVQQAVNRIQSEEQTRSVVDHARKQGFQSVSLDLIYGLPLQTPGSFHETLQKTIEIQPDRISVFNYAHLPSRFGPQRKIREEDLPTPQQKLDILQDCIESLTQAGYRYIGMDHFAKPSDELAIAQRNGTLHRNFQGYSTHASTDLVAMGISSIGEVNGLFAQNVKTLDEYYGSIDQGRLPVFRGVLVTEDDRIRGAVIQSLMCHYELVYGDIEEKFAIRFAEYFAEELNSLSQMEEDGMLLRDQRGIRIMPRGKLLLRNIAMVFDRYLKAPQAATYSKTI